MEKEPIRHADQTWLNTHPQVQEVGHNTTVATIARLTAVARISLDHPIGAVKEGDQIEWKAELKGRITVDRAMLDAAAEQLLR